jgi:hypothetical protein
MEKRIMTTLHAQPYSLDARGFYFDGLDDYQTKYDINRDHYGYPVEEYEIQMIEEDETGDAQLFEACSIDQASLVLWFDEIENLKKQEKAALFYLLSDLGYSVSDALAKVDEVSLFEGDLLEAATDFFDEVYANEIPGNLRFYIDYGAFAQDCRLGGDMSEFKFAGTTYTCTNANGI